MFQSVVFCITSVCTSLYILKRTVVAVITHYVVLILAIKFAIAFVLVFVFDTLYCISVCTFATGSGGGGR